MIERRVSSRCDLPDHLVHRPVAQLGHQLPRLLRDEEEELRHVLRLPGETLSQLRTLGRDADRTGIQMTYPHQDAAHRDQRRGREAELVGPEQRADHDVAPGLEAAVDLETDAPAQIVLDEGLLRLGESDLPRASGILDRRERRSAGAAIVACDQDAVGLALRDARRDRPDAGLGDQLDADVGTAIGVLEIVDQLGQILDRVDVVMRRRRSETDARRRVARRRDDLVDLVTGKLTALARLRTLGDLDLELVGVDEIGARHAEAARRNLLDRAASRISVGVRLPALGIFAALSGIAPAPDPVHRDRERLVCLGRDRAIGHRPRAEARDDRSRLLHLFEGHRIPVELEVEQPAQGPHAKGVVVRGVRVFLEALPAVVAHRALEVRHGFGIEGVLLASQTPLIEAPGVELRIFEAAVREASPMAHLRLAGDHVESDSRDARMGSDEGEIDDLPIEPDRLEDLRTAIALERRDPHLREDLEQSQIDRLQVVLFRTLRIEVVRHIGPVVDELAHRLEGEIGIDPAGAVPDQQREVRHLASLARLDRRDRSAFSSSRESDGDGPRRWRAARESVPSRDPRRDRTGSGC